MSPLSNYFSFMACTILRINYALFDLFISPFRYTALLEQFSAVSYGDHLFSCFLLLPLQQVFSSHLRKLVWGENPTIIRVFSLPLTEVRNNVLLIDRQNCFLSTPRPLNSRICSLFGHTGTSIFGQFSRSYRD